MKTRLLIVTTLVVSCLSFDNVYAQQGIVTSYSNVVDGSGNSLSSSIGQIEYKGASGASGLLIEGLQQPKEISGSVLPITLIYFKATLNKGQVDLTWATANEMNNNTFVIERSSDSKHFIEILRKTGFGNSNANHKYSATDLNPIEGYSYYRLKQVDDNGAFSYSSIETIFIAKDATQIAAMPNPAKDYLSISLNGSIQSENLQYSLVDMQGKKVISGNINQDMVAIDISQLSTGNYILNVYDGNNLIKGFKIVKQ